MDCLPLGKAVFVLFHSGSVAARFKGSKWFSVVFCHFMRDELNKVVMWAGQRMSCK